MIWFILLNSQATLFQTFNEIFRIDLSSCTATALASNVTFEIDSATEAATYTEAVTGGNTRGFWRLVLQRILTPGLRGVKYTWIVNAVFKSRRTALGVS